jgi:hypothetical protein
LYPHFGAASAFIADLKAGDVLYLPPFWFHRVIDLQSSLSISVNIWSDSSEGDVIQHAIDFGFPAVLTRGSSPPPPARPEEPESSSVTPSTIKRKIDFVDDIKWLAQPTSVKRVTALRQFLHHLIPVATSPTSRILNGNINITDASEKHDHHSNENIVMNQLYASRYRPHGREYACSEPSLLHAMNNICRPSAPPSSLSSPVDGNIPTHDHINHANEDDIDEIIRLAQRVGRSFEWLHDERYDGISDITLMDYIEHTIHQTLGSRLTCTFIRSCFVSSPPSASPSPSPSLP